MARCPSCNKFASYDEADPEVNNIEIDKDGNITAEVRIVNTSTCCGDELTETTFNFEETVDIGEHEDEGHDLEIEEAGAERTSKSGYYSKRKKDRGTFIPAYGRYAKTFYGVELSYKVTCSCGDGWESEGQFSDEIQASWMDELT